MDTRAFFDRVQAAFPGDPQGSDPRDGRWQELAGAVAGYTAPNELAVLAAAAATLPGDEAYLEVGTFKGRSICAAVQDASGRRFYAMENFLEFGMAGQEARTELADNLRRHAADADVHLLEGDCFTLMAKPGTIDRPVGVYFYDGEHTLLAHYLALAVVEPLLADEALVLVDDASWPLVQRAHRLFMRRHPGWSVAATWDAEHADDPRWANGLHALVFRRTGTRIGLTRTDEALRRYQTGVQVRLNTVAWRAVDRFPGFFKRVAGLVLSRSRAIDGEQR